MGGSSASHPAPGTVGEHTSGSGAGACRGFELENTFRKMAEFSHKVPVLPEEAFTREGLYRDHD